MEDSEHVCPLCCEEMDLSDREFYPCKCGYQVCMWCWHRIRETESGLCPACRTPYGEDPHQFSAVDVDKAIKANKEKEAAAKRDRQRSSQQNPATGQLPSENNQLGDAFSETSMDVPKDRTLLANMRVIRRNLVYAVGLPPTVGAEDNLRKPDYFGQYGKIAKIVVNRSQANIGDPRRASVSAYVTFVHKEDTLACILAMDGFHMEGRNVRASYGTSKYCSAFIKNMRCNNPQCTYLHEMGAAEDTFTKQEIQAGYVTSGRDVLARQQQILAEQMKLSGAGSAPRKRVGGGGPSGTGKASSHPIFPAPEYDEPAKPNPTLVPPPSGATRASTTGSTVAPRTAARPAASVATTKVAPVAAATAANVAPAAPQPRKTVSAASVVAGVHTVTQRAEPEPHTTLTPLTPLKRTSKSSRASTTGDIAEKTAPARSITGVAKKKNGISGTAASTATAPMPQPVRNTTSAAEPAATPVVASAPVPVPVSLGVNGKKQGPSSIGGDPIGPPAQLRNTTPVSSLAGDSIGPDLVAKSESTGPSSLLGGAVFTGELQPKPISAIGRGGQENDTIVPTPGSSSLWGGQPLATGAANGGVIGGSRAPGPGTIGNSSSALASLLGISLPTGTGSLQESNWNAAPGPTSLNPSPLSSLNSGSVPVQGNVIGGGHVGGGTPPSVGGGALGRSGSSMIGGIPIGGSASSSFDYSGPGAIGGASNTNGGANTKNDVALLQSLLPGVHITSGSESAGFGGVGGWDGRSGPSSLNGDAIGGNNNNNNNWGGAPSERGAAPVGTIGGGVQQNQRGPGIW